MNRFTSYEDGIKVFGMTNQIAETELSRIERELEIGLGRNLSDAADRDEVYYPQFEQKIRKEAAEMAKHYEFSTAWKSRLES